MEVSEVRLLEIIQNKHLLFESIGIRDEFGQSAQDYDTILKHYGLTESNIREKVNGMLLKS